jgi:hypothetical protein
MPRISTNDEGIRLKNWIDKITADPCSSTIWEKLDQPNGQIKEDPSRKQRKTKYSEFARKNRRYES